MKISARLLGFVIFFISFVIAITMIESRPAETKDLGEYRHSEKKEKESGKYTDEISLKNGQGTGYVQANTWIKIRFDKIGKRGISLNYEAPSGSNVKFMNASKTDTVLGKEMFSLLKEGEDHAYLCSGKSGKITINLHKN